VLDISDVAVKMGEVTMWTLVLCC